MLFLNSHLIIQALGLSKPEIREKSHAMFRAGCEFNLINLMR